MRACSSLHRSLRHVPSYVLERMHIPSAMCVQAHCTRVCVCRGSSWDSIDSYSPELLVRCHMQHCHCTHATCNGCVATCNMHWTRSTRTHTRVSCSRVAWRHAASLPVAACCLMPFWLLLYAACGLPSLSGHASHAPRLVVACQICSPSFVGHIHIAEKLRVRCRGLSVCLCSCVCRLRAELPTMLHSCVSCRVRECGRAVGEACAAA